MKGISLTKLEQLMSWVKGIEVAMLTTGDRHGSLRSRPMVALGQSHDNAIWFFTEASSHKVDDVQGHHAVNVSYSDPARGRFISISGRARVVRDRTRFDAYWEPQLNTWFPKGPADGDLALLRIEVREAELWQMPDRNVELTVQLASTESKPHELLTFA